MLHKIYPDFPINCELTKWCQDIIDSCDDAHEIITGFCSGEVVGINRRVFFKASWVLDLFSLNKDGSTLEQKDYTYVDAIYNEEKCLELLNEYSFIPRFITRKKIGKYYFLFMEIINGTSLNYINFNSPQWKMGVHKCFEYLLRLYKEVNFVHGDLDPNNIMIDSDDNVYIIDLSTGSFDYTNSWTEDLLMFINRITDESRVVGMSNEVRCKISLFYNKLLTISDNLNRDDYKIAIDEFLSIID